MLVIVGHGPSIVGKRLGSWLDEQTVVRLKDAPRANREDWGARTDYQCASTHLWPDLGCPIWVLHNLGHHRGAVSTERVRVADCNRWHEYFAEFRPTYKMSTGLRAVFCAAEFLNPPEIGLVGFDNLFRPHERGWTKWSHERHRYQQFHDLDAEHRAAFGLGITLIDVTKDLDGSVL